MTETDLKTPAGHFNFKLKENLAQQYGRCGRLRISQWYASKLRTLAIPVLVGRLGSEKEPTRL
jgi:hypothetical protein